jgi:hypothetical protein
MLDDTAKSLRNTMEVLKFYAEVPGLNFNLEKSKAVWFGYYRNSQEDLCPNYNLDWNTEVCTVLGMNSQKT